MVFCKECHQKVEDCPHFVSPISAKRIEVFDIKVKTLAYDPDQRILEIAFKTGQVWQLLGVPAGIYQELRDSTISSFLKFIAQRYKVAPVRIAPSIPATQKCPKCAGDMQQRHRTGGNSSSFVRVLWHCSNCDTSHWQSYGEQTVRERRGRWH